MRLIDEKITKLRKAKKSNQFVFAEAIHSHPLTVSNVETGKSKYSHDCIRLAKVYLDIVDMPLTEDECVVSNARLNLIRDYVRDDRLKDARVICDEMAKIVNLEPVDKYLPMLYRLYEVVLLLAERNLDTAEEKLTYLQGRLDEMNDKHRYYFYRSLGELNNYRVNYEDALGFYKQAIEISTNVADFSPSENARLHFCIAYSYSCLEFPYRAILYIEKNRELLNMRQTEKISIMSGIVLALNYIKIETLDEAERLLKSCLTRSKSIKDNTYTLMTLHYYGFMYMKHENWKMAEDYLDQALQYCDKDSPHYLPVLQRKILCLVKSRNFPKARNILMETSPYHHACEIFSINFEALKHYITISSRMSLPNHESIKYIESTAIPHFIKACDYFLAMEYYNLLESYYQDKNTQKLHLASVAIRKIYERCFLSAI